MRQVENVYSGLRNSREWKDYEHTRTQAVEFGNAELLSWQGNFGEAERRYRRAVEEGALDFQANEHRLSRNMVTHSQSSAISVWAAAEASLAKNLRSQGRPAEAESYARNALLKYLRTAGRYSRLSAGAIAELGSTVLDSSRK
jgi:hypothetical protein